jgi:hypothetical protein
LASTTGVEGVTITFFSVDVVDLPVLPPLLLVESVELLDFVDSQPAIVKNMQMKIE